MTRLEANSSITQTQLVFHGSYLALTILLPSMQLLLLVKEQCFYSLEVLGPLHTQAKLRPWPCGEGPWFSTTGCNMNIGIAILCSHMLSSIVWSENEPCWKTIAYSIGEKRGTMLPWHEWVINHNLCIKVVICGSIFFNKFGVAQKYAIKLEEFLTTCSINLSILS